MIPGDCKKLILIAGPTASGKSDLGQSLALERGGEIINYDSQQFYRGLDIGTGKVLPAERKVSHWLLDTINPGSFMTAMEFVRQAELCIKDIQERGKLPILVGGTGLYLRALLEGLDPLPPRDPEIRQRLHNELNELGNQKLFERLEKVDPLQAHKISPNDSSRLIRFLEIFEVSGQPPSSLMKRGRGKKLKYSVESYWLQPDRLVLRDRIAQRVASMFAGGWVEEVRNLMKNAQDPRHWENKPIGYGDIAEALVLEGDLQGVQGKITQKTGRYAKRQDTFFRSLFKNPAYQGSNCLLRIIKDLGTNFILNP